MVSRSRYLNIRKSETQRLGVTTGYSWFDARASEFLYLIKILRIQYSMNYEPLWQEAFGIERNNSTILIFYIQLCVFHPLQPLVRVSPPEKR